MTRIVHPLLLARRGSATIEYAIAVGVITLAVVAVLWQIGPKLLLRWAHVDSKLDDAHTIVINDAPPPKPQKP
jgi:Flp pilus assembly pilin Flp